MQASLQYCIMDNIYKKHFFTGALKNLLKFLKQFLKKICAEAAVLRCLQDRCPEKIYKLHIDTPALESLFKIKRLQYRCFPVNFAKLLRTPFLQSTSGGVGVCLLCFTFRGLVNSYLIVWSFSMLIAKTICDISISCFSTFFITCFFY